MLPRPEPFIARAAATYGTNLAVAVLSLVNVLVVARALGPEGRGDVVLLTTIAMVAASVSTLGLQEANANIAGTEPARRPALATNSLLLAATLGGAAIGILALLVELAPAVLGDLGDRRLHWLALAVIPFLVLQLYLQLLVQADYGFAFTNAVWLLPPTINVSVNGALVVLGWISVGAAVATWVAGQALATALLGWYVARRLAGFGRPDVALARRALGFGVKAHAGRVFTLGNYRLDHWILGAVGGSRELGLYSVAVAWAETLFYLPTTLTMVLRPDVVRASAGEAGRRAAAVLRVAIVLTLPLAAGLALAAPALCRGVFGAEFSGSVDDLRILVLGAFGMVALKLLGHTLTAQRRPLLATSAVGVAFAATVVLDVLLIPRYGGEGAAAASTLAYTAGGVAVAILFARALRQPLRDLFPRGLELRTLRRLGGPPR